MFSLILLTLKQSIYELISNTEMIVFRIKLYQRSLTKKHISVFIPIQNFFVIDYLDKN